MKPGTGAQAAGNALQPRAPLGMPVGIREVDHMGIDYSRTAARQRSATALTVGRTKRKTPVGFPTGAVEFLHPPIVACANDGGALVTDQRMRNNCNP